MQYNDPEVVREITDVFAHYERALIAKDLDALEGFFIASEEVVRFGVNDQQRGAQELAVFRLQQAPPPPGRTLFDTQISTFGDDVAIVATCFRYPGSKMIGRQSQTWLRCDDGWKIVHAHVSQILDPNVA